ncbi:MAG: glycosyltransferase family 4 protein [Flavobacteriaceae bacterium]|nr:glycosyltransferase family 4 protein [Flavobacteriaceae bacterium]
MKKALVHDWLVTYAGAERCVESFTNIWNDFDIFTLVDYLNDKDREIILKNKTTTTSIIQKLPFSKTKYRNYLPLFPYAIEQFDLSEYDLILSSSHAVAKGVLTRPDQFHISYVYSPIRYVWDLYFQYLKESNLDRGIKGFFARYFIHKIRNWDYSTANRVDHYFAISKYIAKRIEKIYGKQADVIYPPVDVDSFTISDKENDDYYITSSRMVPYKRIDLIVKAFSLTKKKLLVIGDGPDYNKIKKTATKNIELLGFTSKAEMISLTKEAKAFIFAAEEDFGIAPVEAQAAGIPVIAFGKGGVLETISGVFSDQNFDQKKCYTGVFYRKQTVESLLEAVNFFESKKELFDKNSIRNHAKKFSKQRFEKEIKLKVESLYYNWKNK